jgi:hypothetical protein
MAKENRKTTSDFDAHAKPFQIVNTPPAGPKERGQMDKSFKLRLFGEKQAGRFDFLCVFM